MKKKNKGFTLVELTVTIVLISLIGVVVIYNMASISKTNKETEYERYISAVKAAAQVYSEQNENAFQELYTTKAYLYITTGDLIESGYLDENLVNPYTEEKIGKNELINASLDTVSAALTFEYPIEDAEMEAYLVSIDDYIANGEPYNCMQGAGTYTLALADENGDLIDMSSAENVEQYKFTCSFPDDWEPITINSSNPNVLTYGTMSVKLNDTKTYDERVNKLNQKYAYTYTPGTYKITYEWITESGTRKQATRNVRVLAQSTAQPEVYAVEGRLDTATTKTLQTPISNATVTTYTYDPELKDTNYFAHLEFKLLIEGSEKETTYTMTKEPTNTVDSTVTTNGGTSTITANRKKHKQVLANELSTAEDVTYVADDGKYTYTVSAVIKGHYLTDYKYNCESKFIIEQGIKVDKKLINVDSTSDAITHQVKVNTPYSTKGIWGMIIRLYTTKNSKSAGKTEFVKVEDLAAKYGQSYLNYILGNANKVNDTYLLADISKSGTSQSETLSLKDKGANCIAAKSSSSSCLTYEYMTVQLINTDGYKGKESDKVKLNLTNCATVIENTTSSSTTSTSGNCKKMTSDIVTKLKKGELKTSADILNCYYDTKSLYIVPVVYSNASTVARVDSYTKYVVLGKTGTQEYADGTYGKYYLVTEDDIMRYDASAEQSSVELSVGRDSTKKTINVNLNGGNYKYSLTGNYSSLWQVKTCDGVYTTSYTYNSPIFGVVKQILGGYTNKGQTFPRSALKETNWAYTISAGVSGENLLEYGKYNQASLYADAVAKYNSAIASAKAGNDATFTAHAGIPTSYDIEVFKTAMNTSSGSNYWLGDSGYDIEGLRVAHGDTTSYISAYLKIANGYKDGAVSYGTVNNAAKAINGTVQVTLSGTHQGYSSFSYNNTYNEGLSYIGEANYMKTMQFVEEGCIVSGNGTASDPYQIYN